MTTVSAPITIRVCSRRCGYLTSHQVNYCKDCGSSMDVVRMPYEEYREKRSSYFEGPYKPYRYNLDTGKPTPHYLIAAVVRDFDLTSRTKRRTIHNYECIEF